MVRKKPIAIFDIDGTIFRSSLTIELLKKLVAGSVFPVSLLKKIRHSELRWLDRQGGYDDYIADVIQAYREAIVGKPRKAIIRVAQNVISEQKDRTYRYTRSLLKEVQSKYFTIGISGSPLEVINEYNKFLRFDKLYGTEFGVDEKGFYTGAVFHEPPHYKKELILRYIQNHRLSLAGSVGVGDTESDVGFLELVERPIAFNPNTVLANVARKRNWPIVIERKDLIVKFQPKKVSFLKI